MGPYTDSPEASEDDSSEEDGIPHPTDPQTGQSITENREEALEIADLNHMNLSRIIPDRVPVPLARTLVAFGFLIAFFAVAAVIHPGSSTARPTTIPEYPLENPGVDTESATETVTLGTLESNQFRIEILAGSDEPRYNVYDSLGNTIALSVTEDELYRIDPLLDITNMNGESAPALMLLEDDLDF